MSFTPGPWWASTIGRRNDGSIAVMSEPGPVAYANVLIETKRGQAHAVADPESQANASLIAAAPKLLAALKASRCEYCGYFLYAPSGDCATCATRVAAIAKAETPC